MEQIIVHDVPSRVLAKLTSDARKRDVSINDAVVSILAKQYGIERESTGAGFGGPLTRTTLILAMPDELHRRIKVDAATKKGATMRGLIVQALARHYKVPVQSPTRRPRGTATATQGGAT